MAAADSRPAASRWLRRAAWALGGLLALWLLAWAAVPPLLKHQLQRMASEQLGRTVTVGTVDFKPWSLELTLTDLAIATADGRAAQLQIQRIYVDVALQSLLRLAPVVDAVQVDAPVVRLTHLGDGHYDMDDVLAKLASGAPKEPGEPLQFAFYNLALQGGSLDFTDNTVSKTHTLRELRLAVPFLSNLPSQREVHTEPLLAFKLNGSAFDSRAESTPFARTRKTDAALKLSKLDLAPYLGYLPASLPVRLQRAVLDADVQLAFEQDKEAVVRLRGTLQASGVQLTDTKQQELLRFDSLKLGLEDLRPLARGVKLSYVELTAPLLQVHQARDGRVNLGLAAAGPPPSAAVASGAPAAGAWKVEIARVALRDGGVNWLDDGPQATGGRSARLALRDLVLDASAIQLPADGPDVLPVPFSAAALLQMGSGPAPTAKAGASKSAGTGTATPVVAGTAMGTGAALTLSGSASVRSASVTATISAMPLSLAAPYVAQFLQPNLGGTLNAALGFVWAAGDAQGKGAALQVQVPRLALQGLALTEGKTTLASVSAVEFGNAMVDLQGHALRLERLQISNPKLQVQRLADGGWMFDAWLRHALPAAAGPAAPTASGTTTAAAALTSANTAPAAVMAVRSGSAAPKPIATAPWKFALHELQLIGGTVGWSDAATPRPVALELSALRVRLKDFATGAAKPSALELSAKVRAGQGETGSLSYRGSVSLEPITAQGTMELLRLPLHALEPYFGDALNIELLRADASFKGTVRYADGAQGPTVRVAGDSALEDFRANSVPGTAAAGTVTAQVATGGPVPARAGRASLGLGEELLAWKALSLRGIELSLAPGTTTTLQVGETALSDFYARVIVRESGRINLQDIVRSQGADAAISPGGTSAAAIAAPAASGTSTIALTTGAAGSVTAASTPAAPPTAASGNATAVAAAPAPAIRFGAMSLLNGRVQFSDRFVKPNYSADLTSLTGRLGAFSSMPLEGTTQLADLELRGQAEGTASLEITGKLNPLANPLALDIKGRVRDLELPPLSPYSIKYAGHGIERGKLSVDVAYLVLPDGSLTASNQIILNQLSFGEAVPGAPASLPVKLAVALLADRNGVIDINLPVSGSLNDPQFRLGPVIFKVIVNLIVKAITSPFSLLASAFGGGGDELSAVAFEPGSAVLGAQATQGLDKVAQALTQRPALKMVVVGTARLEAEREGFRRARLQALLQAEKRRMLVLAGTVPSNTATLVVSAAEYPQLLKAVYVRADMPKPRNLVGMLKDIPEAEMEALLLANISVSEERMRELATQRAVAVRDYLATRNLPTERLFMAAVKTSADAAPAGTPPVTNAPAWSPRAELQLSTN